MMVVVGWAVFSPPYMQCPCTKLVILNLAVLGGNAQADFLAYLFGDFELDGFLWSLPSGII